MPQDACKLYHEMARELINKVDQALAGRADIMELIGNNPIEAMCANHRHHFSFMSTVFSINGFELLARTVEWVYRSYTSHGFSSAYFPIELNAWIAGINELADPVTMMPITRVYRWILSHHDDYCMLAASPSSFDFASDSDLVAIKEDFKVSLLTGDHHSCVRLAAKTVTSSEKIEDFYLQVIQPVMYEIGWLWETARITVAQEHVASAIASRVMTAISLMDFPRAVRKGKAIVTSALNDHHEMGAWMIADLLELDGWDVTYLGANTPVPDLIAMVETQQPDLLGISITMPFYLGQVKAAISSLRANDSLSGLKIMVGGRCINENPEIAEIIGADAYALNAADARKLVKRWLDEREIVV